MIKGHFIGLSQNRKGYMVSNSQNPLRVCVSHNVTFIETSQTSEHMSIQIDKEMSESDKVPINVEGSDSKVENLVTEDDDTGNGDITEMTIEDILIQLHQSTRVKHTPTQDDNP